MPVRDAAERLWSRVDRSDPEACWLWPGATSQGYGRIKVDGKMCQAHRAARARPILMPWSDPAKRQEVSDGCS